ncbi:MAG: hypothetical protein ACI9LN_002579, partial [Saprospiraceae bacterium]
DVSSFQLETYILHVFDVIELRQKLTQQQLQTS